MYIHMYVYIYIYTQTSRASTHIRFIVVTCALLHIIHGVL